MPVSQIACSYAFWPGRGFTTLGGVETLTFLHNFDWASLKHAYGSADDALMYLQNLLGENPKNIEDSIDYLWDAIMHQGTFYSATVPVVRVLLHALAHKELADAAVDQVIDWLGEVANRVRNRPDGSQIADAISYFATLGIDLSNQFDAQYDSQCIELAEYATQTLLQYPANTHAITEWALLIPPAQRMHEVQTLVAHTLTRATTRVARIEALMDYHEVGGDISSYLDDSDIAVRASAALLLFDDRATQVLIEAICGTEDPREWFPDIRPAQYNDSAGVRDKLIHTLVQRNIPIDDIVPVAMHVLSQPYLTDEQVGPLLCVTLGLSLQEYWRLSAPPQKLPVLSPNARKVLGVYAENDCVWNPHDGNHLHVRRQLGLPHDRQTLYRMIEQNPPIL
ncbi:hypothetical protein [Corynebacterium freiburgense]|uniref:hypothetical protein n=1 Tax=Corynebacterium freiburgense TaxID=556548 RepID=UPI000400A83E|nr:hypothetical protein [Corynebacterium freiburgense]WJZ02168.1 hypothetical protein CFREI_04350 [Corynebacterium freiburgense]